MDINTFAKYGPDAMWLYDQVHAWWEKQTKDLEEDDEEPYPCADSFRIARKGDTSDEETYRDAMSCCGQVDVEFGPSPLGHTYMYGFNYGH